MAEGENIYGESPYAAEGGYQYEGTLSTVTLPKRKRYLFKMFTPAGTFITTLRDVMTEPNFTIDLNGGFSELVLELARPESNYDEGISIAYGNQLKIYAFDLDAPYDGVCVYSGVISRYIPSIIGSKETVKVTFLSYTWELAQRVIESAGATTIVYTGQDPTAILRDALDKFTAAGGRLDYGAGTTDLCGTSVSYTFNTSKFQDVIQKILDVAPYDWYLRVGADDLVYFKQKSATADHILTLGKEISEYTPEKRTENIVNTIYFVGGGGPPKLYKKYVSSGSVTAYGTHAQIFTDERVTNSATSDAIKNRIFAQLAEPEIRVTLKIMDNNGEAHDQEKGYDIESLFVGQTVQIQNATSKNDTLWDEFWWDVDSWDYNITNAAGQLLQIVRIQYAPDYAVIELSNKQPNIVRRIEEINQRVLDAITVDNPATPS